MKIKIKIEAELDLENLFVTAIEGGSNYWCSFEEESIITIRAVMPKSEEPCFSVACMRAVVEKGVKVPVYDAEDDSLEPIGYLDYSLFEERLNSMTEDEHMRKHLLDMVNEEYDANTADVIFQYLILNEVVYG